MFKFYADVRLTLGGRLGSTKGGHFTLYLMHITQKYSVFIAGDIFKLSSKKSEYLFSVMFSLEIIVVDQTEPTHCHPTTLVFFAALIKSADILISSNGLTVFSLISQDMQVRNKHTL